MRGPSAEGTSAGSTGRSSQPVRRAAEAAMYPSVGNVVASTRISSRPSGASRTAPTRALKTLTLVESPTTIWPGAAPTSGAIRSPIRSGAVHHPLSSQERMRSSPH